MNRNKFLAVKVWTAISFILFLIAELEIKIIERGQKTLLYKGQMIDSKGRIIFTVALNKQSLL